MLAINLVYIWLGPTTQTLHIAHTKYTCTSTMGSAHNDVMILWINHPHKSSENWFITDSVMLRVNKSKLWMDFLSINTWGCHYPPTAPQSRLPQDRFPNSRDAILMSSVSLWPTTRHAVVTLQLKQEILTSVKDFVPFVLLTLSHGSDVMLTL